MSGKFILKSPNAFRCNNVSGPELTKQAHFFHINSGLVSFALALLTVLQDKTLFVTRTLIVCDHLKIKELIERLPIVNPVGGPLPLHLDVLHSHVPVRVGLRLVGHLLNRLIDTHYDLLVFRLWFAVWAQHRVRSAELSLDGTQTEVHNCAANLQDPYLVRFHFNLVLKLDQRAKLARHIPERELLPVEPDLGVESRHRNVSYVDVLIGETPNLVVAGSDRRRK